MNIETTIITKELEEFRVENVEDMIIRVNARQVEQIMLSITDVEEDEMVVLLATIQKNRIAEALENRRKKYKKIEDDVANRAIVELLGCYSVNNLIGIFEEIKYYQIKEILESDSPVRALDKYI